MTDQTRRRRWLNAGCGRDERSPMRALFAAHGWEEVRLDADPEVKPDIVASITDLSAAAPDGSFDAVYCSHSLEHLRAHEVLPALKEFRRVLRDGGFALITCPNLEVAAQLMIDRGLDAVAYQSPLGPITAHDMIFGHGRSIMMGQTLMSHNTGFTVDTLGRIATDAGFAEARVDDSTRFDLWAVFMTADKLEAEWSAMFAGSPAEALFPGVSLSAKAQN